MQCTYSINTFRQRFSKQKIIFFSRTFLGESLYWYSLKTNVTGVCSIDPSQTITSHNTVTNIIELNILNLTDVVLITSVATKKINKYYVVRTSLFMYPVIDTCAISLTEKVVTLYSVVCVIFTMNVNECTNVDNRLKIILSTKYAFSS